MKCLMELDKGYGLTWPEKVAYLSYRFYSGSTEGKCPVKHVFEPGVYIREMVIPKGTLFTGRPHRYGHRVELVSGEVLLIEEHRKIHAAAPFSIDTTPCYMTVLIAKTDVMGRTYHPNPTESRDTKALEDDIFRSADEVLMIGEAVHNRILAIEHEVAA